MEVPPLGFVCVVPGSGPVEKKPVRSGFSLFRKPPKRPLPMAEMIADHGNMVSEGGAVLRNEFFELAVDPHTGAIRSIFDFHSRAPRLAQQLAMRLPGDAQRRRRLFDHGSRRDPRPGRGTGAGRGPGPRTAGRSRRPTPGRLSATHARHLGQPRDRAGNRTRSPAATGRRPVEFVLCGSFRLGTGNADALSQREPGDPGEEAGQLESPHFVEIRDEAGADDGPHGGPAVSSPPRPAETRFAVVVRGETARRFRLGIGIDAAAADGGGLGFRGPVARLSRLRQARNDSAWLFHLDSRSVVATHWEPIVEGSAVIGFRVRLLETQGRHVSLRLRSFRPHDKTAGGADRPPIDLTVEGDRVTVPLRPYEWAEVECIFLPASSR